MKKYILLLILIIAAAAVLSCSKGDAGPAGPDAPDTATAVFQNGVSPSAAYAGCEDATLQSDTPDDSSGDCSYLISGRYDGTEYRTVIKFDLSYIVPANVKVKSARLILYTDNTGDISGTNTHTAYALTHNWTEGIGACAGGGVDVNVSWNNFDGTANPWTAPGGDFSATAASNAVPVTTVANGTAISFNLNASVVQSWISSPSTNYGIIIKDSAATGDNWLRPCSSEIAGTAYRPKLEVNYTLE